jgi:glutaredoxin
VNYDITENHKFVVYCFEGCAYCTDTFSLLSDLNLSFRKVTLEEESPSWLELKAAYRHDTVPIIFRNHDEDLYELIGGFDDLREYLNYYKEEDEPGE